MLLITSMTAPMLSDSLLNPLTTSTPSLTDTANEPDEETLAFAAKVFAAAREGDVETLGPLLDAGLPADLSNDKGDTLLMLASYHGHEALTERLLKAGADPAIANDRGQTPLAGAAFKGETAIARLLLDHGAPVEDGGPGGKPPLTMAAMFDRVEILDLLIERGADPAKPGPDGSTALGAAKAMGAKKAAAFLEAKLG